MRLISPPLLERRIYVYCDEGASMASVVGWERALIQEMKYPRHLLRRTNAKRIERDLAAQVGARTLFIMPGGADMAFLQRLGTAGILRLRSAVERGATYIGTCAGAYFASRSCIFEAKDPKLRVVGTRPLSLAPYDAIGAIRAGFSYGSERGASLEQLTCQWGQESFNAVSYCNGGCAWQGVNEHTGTKVLARYTGAALRRHDIMEECPAAVIVQTYGNGVAVLAGVHPELVPLCTVDNPPKLNNCSSTTINGREKGRFKLLCCMLNAAGLRLTSINTNRK